MQPFFRAVQNHRFPFLSMPGVVSMGLGFKSTRGFFTGIPSLIFGVKKKLPPYFIPKDQLLPRTIDSLPTDVIQVGSISLLGMAMPIPANPPGAPSSFRKTKVRPAQPGVSIGHYKSSTGTFGALVSGDFQDGIAILSNNHILANGTSGHDGLARAGDAILQPGPYDEGGANDVIARLHSYSPLVTEKKGGSGQLNRIDAALAVPVERGLVTGSILGLGPVRSTETAKPGTQIFKSGRSSGVTRGPVFTVGTTIRVESEDKIYIFEDQMGIISRSEPGDSGSLVVSQHGKAVGLLFAGSGKYSFANPINSVLEFFNVTLYDK